MQYLPAKSNKYGAIGSPCLHPLSIGKKIDLTLACKIEALKSVFINLIQGIKLSLKPNNCKTYINFQDIESKAFSKSIGISNPFLCLASV